MKTIRLWSRIAIAMLLIPVVALMLGYGSAESGTAQELTQKPETPKPAQEPAQPPGSPLPPATPPELFKPDLPPSELNDADAVFRKLDVAKQGYITLEDVKDLLGFEEAFRAVDTKGSGRLTQAQFRKAWSIYKSKQ